jgi:hypothetical protein
MAEHPLFARRPVAEPKPPTSNGVDAPPIAHPLFAPRTATPAPVATPKECPEELVHGGPQACAADPGTEGAAQAGTDEERRANAEDAT